MLQKFYTQLIGSAIILGGAVVVGTRFLPEKPLSCDRANRISIERPELRAALLKELQGEHVPVGETEAGELCYPPELSATVRAKLVRLDLEQRPPNEITILGGDFGREVLRRLDQAGIRYSHTERGDDIVLLVSRREDMEVVSDIVDVIARSFFESK